MTNNGIFYANEIEFHFGFNSFSFYMKELKDSISENCMEYKGSNYINTCIIYI